jgi:predicted nucleotidyltransferase
MPARSGEFGGVRSSSVESGTNFGTKFPVAAPHRLILKEMATQLDDRLAGATLSEAERNTVRRFVALIDDALGDDLRGLWLYGSRARGEVPREDSDVDLLLITTGDRERRRLAMDLSETAALAEDESPFTYSVHVHDEEWLRGRREIESFFIGEVDRDKIVLAGSALQ